MTGNSGTRTNGESPSRSLHSVATRVPLGTCFEPVEHALLRDGQQHLSRYTVLWGLRAIYRGILARALQTMLRPDEVPALRADQGEGVRHEV